MGPQSNSLGFSGTLFLSSLAFFSLDGPSRGLKSLLYCLFPIDFGLFCLFFGQITFLFSLDLLFSSILRLCLRLPVLFLQLLHFSCPLRSQLPFLFPADIGSPLLSLTPLTLLLPQLDALALLFAPLVRQVLAIASLLQTRLFLGLLLQLIARARVIVPLVRLERTFVHLGYVGALGLHHFDALAIISIPGLSLATSLLLALLLAAAFGVVPLKTRTAHARLADALAVGVVPELPLRTLFPIRALELSSALA